MGVKVLVRGHSPSVLKDTTDPRAPSLPLEKPQLTGVGAYGGLWSVHCGHRMEAAHKNQRRRAPLEMCSWDRVCFLFLSWGQQFY